MLQLITPIAMASSSTTSPKCIGFVTGFSRNVSAGTSRSAATWRSTNSMPAGRRICCRGTTTAVFKGACGFCRRPAQPCSATRSLRCLDGQPAPASDTIWESSRFGVDLCSREEKTGRSIARATYELFAGMIEFGLMRQLTDIVTVTDARMERILCRARWPLRRLGSPRAIGKTIAVAGYLEVSQERLARVREAGGLAGS